MSAPAAQPRFEPFRLRGANFNLLVLRLLDARPEVIVPALGDQFRRAPGFLRFAPIVIGLDDIAAAPHEVDFARLVAELRNIEIMPIGTTGGTPEMKSLAQSAGLPPLRAAGGREEDLVRAGQRVWAQGADLIVTGTVNAGAEVIADGNLHVYGALRGRAIAGGADNTDARVFALNFDPELVSIAGYYAVREGLTDAPIGKPVQVRLIGESMRFDKLG
jgi:septum site-determining protein MinC